MRLHDWQIRLAAHLAECREKPFAWGSHDCSTFAADCVLAVTGADPAADVRGTYSSALGAARVLKARGGLAGVATRALGEPVSPLMASVGDVVLVDMGGRDALALCNGTSVLGPGPAGLVAYGMGIAKAAWRVG